MGGIMTEEEWKAGYYNSKCKRCGKAGSWFGDVCNTCVTRETVRYQEDMWAGAVLRRCEEDAEFRERLREALGVK